MTLSVERGRVLGRLNLIDGLVVVLILCLGPLGYAAYRIFRIPPPHVAAVEPKSLAWNGDHRILVTGDHFIPYLRVFFSKTGDALAIFGRDPAPTEGRFLIESPVRVEIKVPELPPGTYDMYLFDETTEVAHLSSAFTIAEPETIDADLDVRVRFVVNPETAALIRPGDRDTPPPPRPFKQEARIIAVDAVKKSASLLDLTLIEGGRRYFGDVAPASVVIATLRVNARSIDGLWRYQNQPLRAGEWLPLRTNDYNIRGLILSAKRVP